MFTEDFIDYLKKYDIDFLKLGDVCFYKNNNELCLTFFCADENFNKIESEKIEQYLKEYINIDNLKYNLKFKKAFLDEELAVNIAKKYLEKENKILYYSMKTLTSKINGNNIEFSGDFSATDDDLKVGAVSLKKYLEKFYFYNFSFNFTRILEENSELEEHRKSILSDIENPVVIERMIVKNIEHIVLEGDYSDCYPIHYFKNEEENVSTCGVIQNIEEKEFKKKNKNNEETTGIRFSLTVKCIDKVFNCSLFPNKKNIDKIRELKVDDEICIIGDYEIFGNSFSFKIKKLAKCKIMPYELKQSPKNKVNNNYVKVFPTKYEEKSQLNLFDVSNELKPYLKNKEFVVFDLETTGLDYLTCKVTEIGAVKIKNGKISEIFSTFINPQVPISAEITKLTSITDEMVKDAPLLEDVIPDFFKFCNNTTLVAQNTSFDFSFIDYNSRKINYIFENEKEDTIVIAKKYIKGLKNYKLKTIAEYLKVPLINAHRAINDALCTAKVFLSLVENYY